MESLSVLPAVDVAYAIFALLLSALFWLAVVLLYLANRQANHWLQRFGVMWIAGNAGLFWLAAGLLRLFSVERAFALNMWSRVLYAMLALYVLGYAIMNYRMVTRGRP